MDVPYFFHLCDEGHLGLGLFSKESVDYRGKVAHKKYLHMSKNVTTILWDYANKTEPCQRIMDKVPSRVQICSPETNRFGVGATGPASADAEFPLRRARLREAASVEAGVGRSRRQTVDPAKSDVIALSSFPSQF